MQKIFIITSVLMLLLLGCASRLDSEPSSSAIELISTIESNESSQNVNCGKNFVLDFEYLVALRAHEETYGFPPMSENLLSASMEYFHNIQMEQEIADELKREWMDRLSHQLLVPEDRNGSTMGNGVHLLENYVVFIDSYYVHDEENRHDVWRVQYYDYDGNLIQDLSEGIQKIMVVGDVIASVFADKDGYPLFRTFYENQLIDHNGELLTIEGQYCKGVSDDEKIFALWEYAEAQEDLSAVSATTYIDSRGKVVIGPLDGRGYLFSNGYAGVLFNGDEKISYIDLEGNVILKAITHESGGRYTLQSDLEHGNPRVFNSIVHPGIIQIYTDRQSPSALVDLTGNPADLSTAGPLLDNEVANAGIWEFPQYDLVVWLGDEREARIHGDDSEYWWLVLKMPTAQFLCLQNKVDMSVQFVDNYWNGPSNKPLNLTNAFLNGGSIK